MNTDELLRANYYFCSAEIRRRIRTGQPIPDWMRRHHENLDTAIRSVAHTRHEPEVDLTELGEDDRIGTAEVADMLSTSRRTAQRRADELGAVPIGKSLVFSRSTVERYMTERRTCE